MRAIPFLLLPLLGQSISAQPPSSRDPWLWPFAAGSIWNTPVGSDAGYRSEGHLKPGAPLKSDTEFHYKISAAAPERAVHVPKGWPVVDGSYGKFLRNMRIDDDIILRTHVSNNCAAFLMPDGDHLEQLEPFIRMEKGGIALGIPAPFNGLSLRGDGIAGTHWGSQLSALGGSLRHGHLTGAIPITQVLKFNCQGKRYLSFDKTSATPGYRWPALNADRYAGDPPGKGGYGGTDPAFVMGSLLAIHPRHDAASLGIKTPPGKLLLKALQDYGAYIVDDAGDDSHHFSLSREALGEFEEIYGYSFEAKGSSTGPAAQWFADVSALISHLSVIANNSPQAIGGGGRPRAPLAPSFGEMDGTPPAPPSDPRLISTTPLTATIQWQPSTDASGISNYWIFGDGKRIAETFGRSTATITGLKPDTSYSVTIRSRDRSLLLSAPSPELAFRTKAIPTGTVLEDFDSGGAPGWTFEGGAAVRSNRLELHQWKGIATAIFGQAPPASFTLSADLSFIGSSDGNRTFIHLDRHDFHQSLFIEIPGGDSPVLLKQRMGGKESILASGGKWNRATGFKITIASNRALAFTAIKDGQQNILIQNLILPAATGGKLAFGVLANSADLDNLNLFPNP